MIGKWVWRVAVGLILCLSVSDGGAVVSAAGGTGSKRVDGDAAALAEWSLRAMRPGAPVDLVAEGIGRLADGSSATMRFLASGRDQTRAEVTIDGRIQFVSAISGTTGFRLRDGVRSDLPLWVTLYGRPDFVPAFSRLREWNEPGTNLEYLGREKVDGRVTHRIRLWASPRDGRPAQLEEWISEYEVFIDDETGLVAKTVGYIFSPEILENRSPVETYYGDWRMDGPIIAPHKVERWVSGQFDSSWEIRHVRVNSGVSASLFR